jgi:hypothetical protein
MDLLKRFLVTCLCACTLVVMTPALTLSISRATGGTDGSAVSAATYNKTTGYEYRSVSGLPTLSELKAGYNRYCLSIGGDDNSKRYEIFASTRTKMTMLSDSYPGTGTILDGTSFIAFDPADSGFKLIPVYKANDTDATWAHTLKIQLANGRYLKRTGVWLGRYCTSVTDISEATVFVINSEGNAVYFKEDGAAAYLGWAAGKTTDEVTGLEVDVSHLDCYSYLTNALWGEYNYTYLGLFKKVQDTSISSMQLTYNGSETVTYTDGRTYAYLPCWVETGSSVTLKVTPKKPWATGTTITFKCPDTGNTPAKVKATVTTSDGYSTTTEYEIYHNNHSYDLTKKVTIKAATCTEAGSKGYKCANFDKCGAYIKTDTIDALGHDWGRWVSNGPYTHTRTCSRCNDTQTENHDWSTSQITKEPTYTSNGIRTWYCSKCNDEKDESIPKLVDNTLPALSASLGSNSWNSFGNTTGAILKYTTTPVINVTASDGDSGLSSVQYYNSSVNYGSTASLPATGWKDVTLNGGSGTIAATANSLQYIYIRAVDNAGNTAYVRIDPIAVYSQSALVTIAQEFNPDIPEDIDVIMELNGNTLDSIKNGTSVLRAGTDYTINGTTAVLSKTYLAGALTSGIDAATLEFSFNMLGISGTSSEMDKSGFTVLKHVHDFVYTKNNAQGHTKTCSTCNYSTVEDHSWNEGEVTTPATYNAKGIKTYTCTKCGETRTEDIDILPDGTAPTLEASVGSRSFDSFGTSGSAMLFTAAPTIDVSAADNESGLKTVEYLNSSTSYDSESELPAAGWAAVDITAGKGTIAVKSQGIQYIYLRATDNQNNVTCVKIDPVVVYGQSSLTSKTAEFNLDIPADIDIVMDLNGNTLSSIKNGAETLNKGTDYDVSGNKVTLNSAYILSRLTAAPGSGTEPPDSFKLTFTFDPQGISDSGEALDTPEFTVTKHVHQYTYAKNNAATHIKSCENCAYSVTEDHEWDDGVVTVPATYNAEGEMLYTCRDCGETRTEKTAMLTDRDLPDVQIKALHKSWGSFSSAAAAASSHKSTRAEITFADGESGVAKAEYLVTSRAYSKAASLPTMGWRALDPASGTGSVALAMDSSQYIYVRVTDNQGNTTIVNSGKITIANNKDSAGGDNNNSAGRGSGSSSAANGTSGGAAQTGDQSDVFIWLTILGLAGAAAAAASRKYRKE